MHVTSQDAQVTAITPTEWQQWQRCAEIRGGIEKGERPPCY